MLNAGERRSNYALPYLREPGEPLASEECCVEPTLKRVNRDVKVELLQGLVAARARPEPICTRQRADCGDVRPGF